MSECGNHDECKTENEVLKTKEKIIIELKKDKPSIRGRGGAEKTLSKEEFLTSVLKSFKWTLHHKCNIKKDDNLLLCCSGGYSSRAMLQLFYDTFSENERKHLNVCKATLLYIDDGEIKGNTEYQRKEDVEMMKKICENYSYRLEIIKMDLKVAEEEFKKFKNKEDIFHILIEKHIVEFARKNKFQKVLLGQNGTRMASKLISETSKGRGGSLPFILDFVDKHYEDVQLLNPMRNLISKEVGFYNYYNHLEILKIRKLWTDQNINKLSEKFIIKLQDQFPSTVHTILGSLEKVKPNVRKEKCLICEGFLTNEKDICYGCQSNLK